MMLDGSLISLSNEIEELAVYDSRYPSGQINELIYSSQLKIDGIISTDITEKFTSAVQQLDVGQIIQDPNFTLFESVGAIEIMDKKMDSGYLEPGETMDDDYDFSRNLLPDEVIGIMDQLFFHEMAWHKGHPLAQTIFTSLHIDRLLWPYPESISATNFDRKDLHSATEPLCHRVLRAYCLGLVKTCHFVNTRINSEHFYEEEDFVTNTFHRNLLEDFDSELILEFLKETKILVESHEIYPILKTALKIRLEFRIQFLGAVKTTESRISAQGMTSWTDLRPLANEMKNSMQYGTPVPSAFSEKLQRKLASTIPPRPIVQLSPEDAFNHLDRLCLDASSVVEQLEYFDSHSLLTFILLIQALTPQPSTYARAILQYYLLADMSVLGSVPIQQVVENDLSTTILPSHMLFLPEYDEVEIPSDPRHKVATQIESFRSHAAGSYLDLMRTLCQNRCRIRRSLCHSIIEWDNLQYHAEQLDQKICELDEESVIDTKPSSDPIWSYPFSSWVYYYKILQMEWIIQLGFELETYQPDELAGMYGYLQYLSKTRHENLKRVQRLVNKRYHEAQQNKNSCKDKNHTFLKTLSFINFASVESSATYHFAHGLSCLFAVLDRLLALQPTFSHYSDDRLRYEVRMKPFLSMKHPKLIPYDEFKKLIRQPDEGTSELLQMAVESTTNAKKYFEILSKLTPEESFSRGTHKSWSNDIKNCLKACILTVINITKVRTAAEASEKSGRTKIKVEIPTIDKGYHNWWTVPNINVPT
ncbi:unnamed protein product [Blumeria hordei]|uniref:Uncharacterized protein n=1 Tax=Blumeria hordei TaxID=2867405 RepID=A0A383UZ28_BLUHO|nr:unnamed protein product [Blumeria hordei]